MTSLEDRSTIVHEWHRQLALAARTPGLVQHLVRHMGELLPRFVAFYRRLRTLPRRVRRALLRRRGLSIAGVALLLALCGGPAHSATIPVDEATCFLADAIVAANNDAATGGCPAGSGDDVLVLDADVTLGASLPSLASTITIQPGLASIVDGAGNACFAVDPAGVVTIHGLTVRNCVALRGGGFSNVGDLSIYDSTLTGNTATGSGFAGGGAVSNMGTLLLQRCTVTGNQGFIGGGVWNVGDMTIEDSLFSENVATSGGGGIGTDESGSVPSTATVSGTVISGNHAAFSGGGVFNYYGSNVTLTNCTISGNTAVQGGGTATGGYCEFGCDDGPATLDIRSSTISGNIATGTFHSGGGVLVYQRGAAILTNSTVSGNSAASMGGGVGVDIPYEYAFLTVTNSTITGNAAGVAGGGMHVGYGPVPVALDHVLLSGNTAPVAREASVPSGPASDNFNVFGTDGDAGVVGFVPGSTDIVPDVAISEILAPLGDNGGPTLTHALVAGGPAVDAVPTSEPNCLGTTDQRGLPRPAGPACDVGSVEIGARFPFGGSVTGITPRKVSCRERSGGQNVQERISTPSWSCEALGLVVQPGDPVQTKLQGTVDATDAHVGGSVTGMTPTSVSCQNNSTGQKVGASTSATSWDCEAMGLVVQPGDTVTTGATGTIDPPPARGGR